MLLFCQSVQKSLLMENADRKSERATERTDGEMEAFRSQMRHWKITAISPIRSLSLSLSCTESKSPLKHSKLQIRFHCTNQKDIIPGLPNWIKLLCDQMFRFSRTSDHKKMEYWCLARFSMFWHKSILLRSCSGHNRRYLCVEVVSAYRISLWIQVPVFALLRLTNRKFNSY